MKACPWDSYLQGSTHFCEATLCRVIESPAIAWAAISYLISGTILFYQISYIEKEKSILSFSPYVAFIMAIGSFGYHATHTYFMQFIDVLGMLSFALMLVLFNFRKGKLSFFLLIFVMMLVFHLFKGISGQVLLGVSVLIYLVSEFSFYKKGRHTLYLKLSLVAFLIGLVSLILEKNPKFCDPDNHIFQWHALWDVMSAFIYYLMPLYLLKRQKD